MVVGVHYVKRDEGERAIDAEAAASVSGIAALHSNSSRAGDHNDAGSTTRRRSDDLRERDPDRREHRSVRREADADTTRGESVDRHDIDNNERPSSDRRSHVDAEALMMRLGQLALSLQDLENVQTTSHAIVAGAVDIVPGAEYAGLSIVAGRRVAPIVVTDDVVSRMDRAQHDTGEGPALTSLRERRTIRVDDLATEVRWPGFADRAARTGLRSMLAVRVFVHHDELGVLTLYSRHSHGFDDSAEQIALLFATHAAVAVAGAQQEQSLTTALTSRDGIGQAKGMLMERYRLSADQAFALLVRASQDTNTKLVDLVRVLTTTGDLMGAKSDGERLHQGRSPRRRP